MLAHLCLLLDDLAFVYQRTVFNGSTRWDESIIRTHFKEVHKTPGTLPGILLAGCGY